MNSSEDVSLPDGRCSLRIAVADDEQDMRDYLVRILPRLGHEVVCVCSDGRRLLDCCPTTLPDLYIVDVKMPGLDGLSAVEQISRDGAVPVIIVSAHHDPDLLRRAAELPVLAYLVKPIKQADLEAAIAMAMRQFEQFAELRREAADLRQALEDRKIIERAKGALMQAIGLDEPTAFRRLQKLAAGRNMKLVVLARRILSGEIPSG